MADFNLDITDTVSSLFETYDSQILNLQDDLKARDEEISHLEADLYDAQHDLDDAADIIAAYEAKITELESDLSSLKTDLKKYADDAYDLYRNLEDTYRE